MRGVDMIFRLVEEFLDEDYLDPEEKFYDFKTPEIVGDKIFADTTGTSYDDLLIDPKYYAKAKNLVGSIKMMTPREYFTECGRVVFNRTFDSMVKGWSQDTERLDPIRTVIHKYKKQLCMPYINYANPGQEGLHRMMVAAELYGWDYEFPVLVIEWADKDLAEQEAKEKRYNKIKRLIEETVEETLTYHFNDMSEVKNQLEWELDKAFENRFDEPFKSFNIIYDDKTVEVSVEDVVYQFDTELIKIEPKSNDEEEIELDDIELDDLDLDFDEFMKKYGIE